MKKKHVLVWGLAPLVLGLVLAGLEEVALAKVPKAAIVLKASAAFPGATGKATFKVGLLGPELVVEVAVPVALGGATLNVSLGGVPVGTMTINPLLAGRLDLVSPTLGTTHAGKAVQVTTADWTLVLSGTF